LRFMCEVRRGVKKYHIPGSGLDAVTGILFIKKDKRLFFTGIFYILLQFV